MKYRVIYISSFFTKSPLSDLTIEVEKHLKDGWKLHGGVSMVKEKGAISFAQALIKEE